MTGYQFFYYLDYMLNHSQLENILEIEGFVEQSIQFFTRIQNQLRLEDVEQQLAALKELSATMEKFNLLTHKLLQKYHPYSDDTHLMMRLKSHFSAQDLYTLRKLQQKIDAFQPL